MVYDQQLCLQVHQLHFINLGLRPHLYGLGEDVQLLDTEETIEQMMKQSEYLPQQLTCEQKTANRRTREMEEEIHDLQRQVSKYC